MESANFRGAQSTRSGYASIADAAKSGASLETDLSGIIIYDNNGKELSTEEQN